MWTYTCSNIKELLNNFQSLNSGMKAKTQVANTFQKKFVKTLSWDIMGISNIVELRG